VEGIQKVIRWGKGDCERERTRAPDLIQLFPFLVDQIDTGGLRLAEDIDLEMFARKNTEMRDRLASIKLQLDVLDRSHDETAELAAKVFELSQTLRSQWLTADYSAKRRILEIVFLNCRLEDANLVPTMRKPFDVLAEGLLSENKSGRGDLNP
jgi:site-specific DNA recombinase